MRVSARVKCDRFPCGDVRHECCIVPSIDVRAEEISIVMISEAAAEERQQYFYARGNPLFAATTIEAFREAGTDVASVRDILALGVYLTTAVKCGKTGYGIKPATIAACSFLLEREISLFPNVKAWLLMGDVAIRAINAIAKRTGEPRVIPAGPTYKIRGGEFHFRGGRAFPSYLQAGASFYIEKSKRRMIAEDIAVALAAARGE
jgi:uracil-DNA glycosylase